MKATAATTLTHSIKEIRATNANSWKAYIVETQKITEINEVNINNVTAYEVHYEDNRIVRLYNVDYVEFAPIEDCEELRENSRVKVMTGCTDPLNKQNEIGYITELDKENETATVIFADGQRGQYNLDVLI